MAITRCPAINPTKQGCRIIQITAREVQIQAEVKELEPKLVEIEAKYVGAHNTRVPLLALPTEVTRLVFQFALKCPTRGHKMLLFEIAASHVCRQWRSMSLTYPHLWASFCDVGAEAPYKNNKPTPPARLAGEDDKLFRAPETFHCNFLERIPTTTSFPRLRQSLSPTSNISPSPVNDCTRRRTRQATAWNL